MNIILAELSQRYGLKVEYSQSKIVGTFWGYNISVEYNNNSYYVQFGVSNKDVNILNNLRTDIYTAMPSLVYLKNPIVNSWVTSFEINDKEYVDYSAFGVQPYITTDIMIQILEYICKLFSAYGMENICSKCGNTGIINTYEISNGVSSNISLLCDKCAVSFNGSSNVKRRIFAILGSFATVLIVAIIYAIIYRFGYILYISGFVLAMAGFIVYQKIIKEVTMLDSIILGIITVVGCFIAQTAGTISNAYYSMSEYFSVSLSEVVTLYTYSLRSGDIFFELIKNTLILIIPALISVIGFMVNIYNKSKSGVAISGTIRRI